jgi:hypothetical protein
LVRPSAIISEDGLDESAFSIKLVSIYPLAWKGFTVDLGLGAADNSERAIVSVSSLLDYLSAYPALLVLVATGFSRVLQLGR